MTVYVPANAFQVPGWCVGSNSDGTSGPKMHNDCLCACQCVPGAWLVVLAQSPVARQGTPAGRAQHRCYRGHPQAHSALPVPSGRLQGRGSGSGMAHVGAPAFLTWTRHPDARSLVGLAHVPAGQRNGTCGRLPCREWLRQAFSCPQGLVGGRSHLHDTI